MTPGTRNNETKDKEQCKVKEGTGMKKKRITNEGQRMIHKE